MQTLVATNKMQDWFTTTHMTKPQGTTQIITLHLSHSQQIIRHCTVYQRLTLNNINMTTNAQTI